MAITVNCADGTISLGGIVRKCELCQRQEAGGTLILEYHEGGVMAFRAACFDCGEEVDRVNRLAYSRYGDKVRQEWFESRFICSSQDGWDRFENLKEHFT